MKKPRDIKQVKRFKVLWKHYVLQSLLAGSVVLVLTVLLGPDRMVTIAALGASAFIVFAMPKEVSAQSRNVIGGHMAGLACGAIFYFLGWPCFVEYPLVVALAIFVMVTLDVEHAPAAGTALAVTMYENLFQTIVPILLAALVLSQCRYLLRHRLRDLV